MLLVRTFTPHRSMNEDFSVCSYTIFWELTYQLSVGSVSRKTKRIDVLTCFAGFQLPYKWLLTLYAYGAVDT
jgi:hypothetical protein